MEVSSKDPSLIAMDLSKGYTVNSLNCHGQAEARDPLLAKKPEWYHRPPPSCSTEVGSTYWNGSRPSSSYSSRIMDRGIGDTGVIQLHPDMGGGVHRREMEPGPEAIGSYMDTTLAQGLGLYHNGAHGHLWHQRFYECDPVESPVPESSGAEESDSGSDVIFLVSTTKDTLVCSSLSRESVSPVVEALSPAAALSMDEGRGCYLLPQPLSSPSPDSTYSEVSSDSSADIPVFHARPVVLLPDIRAVCTKMNPIDSPVDVSSDDSDVVEVSVTNERKKVIVFPDSVPSGRNSAAEETLKPLTEREPRSLRRSARIKVATPTTLQFTHSVSPPPPQRRHNLRTQNAKRGFYTECYDSDDVIESLERLSSSEEEPVLSTPKPGAAAKSNDFDRADTKSDDSDRADTKSDDSDRADTKSDDSDRDDSDRDTQHSDHLPKTKQNKRKTLPIRECKRFSTKPEPHHGTPAKQHIKVSADSKAPVKKSASTAPVKKTASTAPVKKTASTRRKKRKRHTETGPSCFFPPGELEIELKYANKYKKEKRQNKSDGFYPFVHVEQKVCTIVNYEEQETKVKCNTRQQRTDTTGLTGLVPNTSCFQLGRLSAESRCQPTQFCCLCGRSANARGLGDLHGPYYPIGASQGCPRHQQSCTEPCLGDVSRRREVDERLHNLANGHAVKMDDKDCDGEGSIAHSDKKPSVVLDSQNDTTAAFHSDECWIHEDCGIWSTGIFLVKGKLYGLCEASSLAQRTVCCICNETGAVMGCFQKGCLQSYHYRCAIESGCVLNEENFSMRCPKHKSAPLTLSVRTQHKR